MPAMPPTTSGPRVPVAIRDVKAHHYVPLDLFDAWLDALRRHTSTEPGAVRDGAPFGLKICDFGNFDLIGYDASVPPELRAIDLTVRVTGLLRLAQSLHARGDTIITGPEPEMGGLRMVCVNGQGRCVEYLESA